MLQRNPNDWSCSITSLAMALRVPVQELVKELGHDGSEIIFPQLPEPMCRRGFHSQELIHLAWKRDFTVTPFELFPAISPTYGEGVFPVLLEGVDHWERFNHIIGDTIGLLEGRTMKCLHTVHYRHGEIWDPRDRQFKYSKEACARNGFFANRALILSSKM